jgi:hypothetical protein
MRGRAMQGHSRNMTATHAAMTGDINGLPHRGRTIDPLVGADAFTLGARLASVSKTTEAQGN